LEDFLLKYLNSRANITNDPPRTRKKGSSVIIVLDIGIELTITIISFIEKILRKDITFILS
jgi:hypothetical protein